MYAAFPDRTVDGIGLPKKCAFVAQFVPRRTALIVAFSACIRSPAAWLGFCALVALDLLMGRRRRRREKEAKTGFSFGEGRGGGKELLAQLRSHRLKAASGNCCRIIMARCALPFWRARGCSYGRLKPRTRRKGSVIALHEEDAEEVQERGPFWRDRV